MRIAELIMLNDNLFADMSMSLITLLASELSDLNC